MHSRNGAADVGEVNARATIAAGDGQPAGDPFSQGRDQRASRNYRPDIDGLRALAVLPIVLCHLGIERFAGGYVGVDIFFVISGYLIGGIVLDQIHRGTYSASAFYIRRFRRIVPALVVTLAVTTAAMCVVALPYPLREYGNSLIAAMLSVSNFFFWLTAGYFEAPAATKPLLHTWSLAVEEQYYLIFPFLMFLVGRRSRRTIQIVLGGLALLSFAASVAGAWGIYDQQEATFYLLPTRLWELLLGVLAVETRLALLDRRGVREALSAIALLLIGLPILLYTPDTPFPGLAALPPCLGTAILLTAGAHGGSISRHGLSLRPLVFFGLISYSLYLWHWPLIVLLKEGVPTPELSHALQLGAFLLSVALAWFSWRVIERPWRDPAIKGRSILLGTAVSAALIVAAGTALVASKGWPSRYPPQVVRVADMLHPLKATPSQKDRCFLTKVMPTRDYDTAFCRDRRDPNNRNILLMGDSHSAHLWYGLHNLYPQLNILQYAFAGCKPVLKQQPLAESRCAAMMRDVFENYLGKRRIDWVILAANWSQQDLPALVQTLDWLRARGIHVVLAGPVIHYRLPLPKLLALSILRDDKGLVDRYRSAADPAFDRQVEQIAHDHGAIYFSTYRTLCRAGRCETTDAAGIPLEFDQAHFTATGSMRVARGFPIEQVALPAKSDSDVKQDQRQDRAGGQ